MIRPDVTFSVAALLESCGWWAMPGVVWREFASEFAEGGTTVHAAVTALVTDGIDVAPADPTLGAMYRAIRGWLMENRLVKPAADLPGRPLRGVAGLRAEVAYAYDTATGRARELVDPAGWDRRWYADPSRRAAYNGPGGPIRASEVPGRLDLLCVSIDASGGLLRNIELKCHFAPHSRAEARAQLEIQSLAAARVPGPDGVGTDRIRPLALHVWEDGILVEHVDEQGRWRFSPPGELGIAGELGAWELTAIADRWAGFARRAAAGNDPVPHAGPHCGERGCKARASCPVTTKIVEEELFPSARLVRREVEQALDVTAAPDSHGSWRCQCPPNPAYVDASRKHPRVERCTACGATRPGSQALAVPPPPASAPRLTLVPSAPVTPPEDAAFLLSPAAPAGIAFLPDPESDAEADWQLVACDLLEELIAAKKKRLEAYADARQGFRRSDGKIWSGQPQPRTSADLTAPGAIQALRALGLEFAVETTVSTSWKAIKELQGERGVTRAKEALGAIDALKTSTSTIYTARKPPEPESAAKSGRRAS